MPAKMNILLVEDNDLDAMILDRTIKKLGLPASVVRACDGIEALAILSGEAPGIEIPGPFFILLDINMPRMNGHDFLQALRARDDIGHHVVFMFTTSTNPEDIAKAYNRHVSGYFVKPQDSADMRRILTSLHKFWELCVPPPAAVRHPA